MTHLVQVAMPYFTGNADDVIVNTFHFNWTGGGSPGPIQFNEIVQRLITFYESCYNGEPSGPGLHLAPWINNENVRFTIYDLSTPTPRVPEYDVYEEIDVDSPTNSSMPLEAACCLSYRADYVPGVARARQRGRIYLGGFTANGVTQGTAATFPGFASGQIAQIASAAGALLTNALADDWVWVVYSRTGNTTYPIAAGWVDSEYDTQRRRGNVLTGSRTPWS